MPRRRRFRGHLTQFVRQEPLSAEELEAAVRRFKKTIIERASGGELTRPLGDSPGGTKPKRLAGFDDKILARYGRGMTLREIQGSIRDDATVRSKAVYLALAVLPDGTRDSLGIWIEQAEGTKFWMSQVALVYRSGLVEKTYNKILSQLLLSLRVSALSSSPLPP
jgi:Transposase, Mutator family